MKDVLIGLFWLLVVVAVVIVITFVEAARFNFWWTLFFGAS